MRLHLSEPAYKALVGIGGYDMMERGEIQVKVGYTLQYILSFLVGKMPYETCI